MKKEKELTTEQQDYEQSVIALNSQNDTDILVKLQKFQKLLHKDPLPESIDKTPDGRASTVTISFIEMLLDKFFFGQWSIENFKWSAITNEVQGSLELVIVHPISGREIRRTGAASVVIMVDKVPDDIKNNSQDRNSWALNPQNKKPNALDMAFPKLKSECIKNAAQSLGKIFGRDLNRKKSSEYSPLVNGELMPKLSDEIIQKAMLAIEQGRKEEVQKLLELPFDVKQKEFLTEKLNAK